MLLKIKILMILAFFMISSFSFSQSCNPSSANCGTDNGCYPRDISDMFEGDASKQEQWMIDVSNHLGSKEPSSNGSSCKDDKDCLSFSCQKINDDGDKQCVAQSICRKARYGETLVEGAKCDEGLIVVNNKCTNDNNGVYAGLPEGDLSPNEKGVCEFEYDPKKYEAGKRSMFIMRAMEVFFSRASTASNEHECLNMAQTLKPIGQDLFNKRKMLVRTFNEEWQKIEGNISTIMSASDTSNQVVTLFGTKISEKEVARRKALGVDMLEIMRRRAVLQKQYENAMLALYNEIAAKIQAIETEMSNIKSDEKQWTIGGKTYKGADQQCRWGFWGLLNRKVWNRWHHYYEVPKRKAEILKSIQDQPNTYSYLMDVYGSEDEVSKKFTGEAFNFWKFMGSYYTFDIKGMTTQLYYYLVDPMFPDMDGQNPFRSYGEYQFFASPNKRRSLKDFSTLPQRFKDVAAAHTAQIKDANIYGADKFMYDPDLINMSAKNCVDKPTNENCGDFTAYKEKLGQIIYGQFLATSRHHIHQFYSHFGNADSGRRRVIADIRSSSAVAEEFYKSMVTYRDKQIACFESQIGNIEDDFMNNEGGISEGNTNYYSGSHAASSHPTKPKSGGVKPGPLNLLENKKWDLSLTSKILQAINPDKLMTNISINAGTRGVFLNDEAQNAMAARLQSMKEINKKSAAAGKKVKEADDQIRNSIAEASAAAKSSSGAQLDSGIKSSILKPGNLGAGSQIDSTVSNKENSGNQSKEAPVFNAGKVENKSAFNENSILPSSSTSGDPTGLSEEEKGQMMANYDRTKGEYKPSEDDGLFNIVSKAYVRSLDRVLKRKKPGED